MMLVITLRLYKNGNNTESLVTIAMTVLTVISTMMESLFGYDGVINVSGAVLLVFYYIYLVTQQFKRDTLTGALTRRSFYSDANNNLKDITAVVSIDLNNLKIINDTQGHAAGDIAICTVTEVIQSNLMRNCFLYRTGGDEFMILCFNKTYDEVNEMVKNIKTNMQQTPYMCAMGIAFCTGMDDFDNICKLADQIMYENKRELKKGKDIR